MKFILIFLISILPTLSIAKNTPCSGKKGGVKHCTAEGKFMCKNGTISASKKKCTR